jgi:PAS domain S-box-containing protein
MRRNRELAVLNAVAATAAKSLDLESILHSCIISVVDSMSYDGGIIYLLDSGCKYLVPGASRGFPNDLRKLLQKVEVGSGYAGTVAKTGKPLFIEQEVRPPRTPLQIQGTGVAKAIRGTHEDSNQVPLGDIDKAWWSSLGFIPIISKDRLLGVMEVTTSKPHEFTEAEKSLLGSVGKTIGVAIDNARLFKDVASAKAEWETTFDAMTNGVSIHNCNFTIVRANKALAKLLGISAKELVGKQCYEVFHGRLKPIADCPHKKAVLTGKNATLIREEPSLGKILSISADPIFDTEGNVVGTVHDVRDITEQEQLRDQLNQTEKLTALGEMAGGVAHDFNNFLTVILGNAQLMLSQSDLNSEDREALKTIERAAGDAAETVRRIQEFTRVRTTRRFTAVNVNEVITNAIEVARPRWKDEANARGAKIELSVKLADVPLVSANESELGEVIINLLLNAADALPEGGSITVKSRVQGDWVEVLVADNGRGMVEDVRRRVFEPFIP